LNRTPNPDYVAAMLRSDASVGVCVGLLLGLLANACGDDSSGTTPGACKMVIDACHPKDDGSDMIISDCHGAAHDGSDATCSTNLQACLDACNAAPPIETADDDPAHVTGGSDESTTAHDHATGTSGADGSTSSSTSQGSTSQGSTSQGSTASSTGADDSSQASCKELGSICHDAADEFGMMCHDVGHDGDEAACAAIWVECLEHCV
jgi:hypothetical protein